MKITVITPAAADNWGEPSETADVTRQVDVIGIAPTAQGSRRNSSDIEDRNREGLVEACTLYMRSQAHGIAHTDKVLLPGDAKRWDVDGAAQSWSNPLASAHGGSVVVLKRRAG